MWFVQRGGPKGAEQTTPPQETVTPPGKPKRKFFLTPYFLALLLLGTSYYLLHLAVFYIAETYCLFLRRFV